MGFFHGLKDELGAALNELMNEDVIVDDAEDMDAGEKLLSDAVEFEEPVDNEALGQLLDGLDLDMTVGDALAMGDSGEERNELEEDQMSIDDLLAGLESDDEADVDGEVEEDSEITVDDADSESLAVDDMADVGLDSVNAEEVDLDVATEALELNSDVSVETEETDLGEALDAEEETHEMSVQDALDSLKDAGMRYEEKQRFEDMISIADVSDTSEPVEKVSLDLDFDGLTDTTADVMMSKVLEDASQSADELLEDSDEILVDANELNTEDDMEEIVEASEDVTETANDSLEVAPADNAEDISEKYDFTYSDDTAVITEGMKMKGDIESDGNLDVMGQVDGNVKIVGKFNCFGNVDGNIEAHEIFADGAKIKGDINVSGSVKIGKSSVILGNISATSAVIAGAVKGNIDVTGPVILDSTAIIMGDVKSMTMQVINGAAIEGHCSQCYAKVSPMSFFNDYNE